MGLVALLLELFEHSRENRLLDEVASAFVSLTCASPSDNDRLTVRARPDAAGESVIAGRDEHEVIETSARQTVRLLLAVWAADEADLPSRSQFLATRIARGVLASDLEDDDLILVLVFGFFVIGWHTRA